MKTHEVATSIRPSLHAREPVTVAIVGAAPVAAEQSAAALAGQLGRGLYRIDLSRVVSKYLGETEKNLEQLFRTAESKHWVLFFDESDALFGSRTEVKDSHDRYANVDVDDLLQRLESYSGLLVVALQTDHRLRRMRARRKRVVAPHGPR